MIDDPKRLSVQLGRPLQLYLGLKIVEHVLSCNADYRSRKTKNETHKKVVHSHYAQGCFQSQDYACQKIIACIFISNSLCTRAGKL